jgi:hypothetical protein
MPLPRVRFTVRRLMVAVAVIGLACGLWRRSAAYAEKARYNWSMAFALMHGYPGPEGRLREIGYLQDLARKYERAARYPFLPVAPDPPEPE